MPPKRTLSKSRNAVVVLGMHRSGTSALAGTLAHLGCELPQTLMPASAVNPKGYYESVRLYEMNESIMDSAGTQWDDWQPFNPDWINSHRAEEFIPQAAKVLADEYGTSRLFVVKDPRICVLLPFWNRVFEQEDIAPVYVHIHRNPVEVAVALNTQEGLPLPYGILLWLRYVIEAEHGSRGATRCFTSDDRLVANWPRVIKDIKERTKLVFPRNSGKVDTQIDAFLTPQEASTAAQPARHSKLLSVWAELILDVLEQWADKGEDKAGYAVFDAVRVELDAAAPVFGALVEEARTTTQQKTGQDTANGGKASTPQAAPDTVIEDYERQAQDMLAQVQAAEAEAEATRHALEQHQIRHRKTEKALAKSDAKRKALRAEFLAQQTAHEVAQDARRSAEQEKADLAARLTSTTEEMDRLERAVTEMDREKWQLQSELAQRTSETVDVGRRNDENTALVATLTAQLEQLRIAQATHVQENEQLKKDARMLRVNLQNETEQKLEATLMQMRLQHSAAVEVLEHKNTALTQEADQLRKNSRLLRVNLQNEMQQRFEKTLMQTRKQSERLREDLVKAQTNQHHRIAELEGDNWALRHSTSWKITKPLRSVILFLRSRRG